MLQQVSEPLRPGNRRCPRDGGQFLRVDPLGEFREDRRHLIESAGMTCVSHKVERRRFRRRNEQRAPRRAERLNRPSARRLRAMKATRTAPQWIGPAVPRDEDLELLRSLMRRTVILCGRQKSRVVGEVEMLHQRRDKLLGGKAAERYIPAEG